MKPLQTLEKFGDEHFGRCTILFGYINYYREKSYISAEERDKAFYHFISLLAKRGIYGISIFGSSQK